MKGAGVKASAAIMECRSEKLAGRLPNYVASADCSAPQIIGAYQDAGYRYMDLIHLLTAKRRVVMEEIDNGQLTEAQAQWQLSQFMSEIKGVERVQDKEER